MARAEIDALFRLSDLVARRPGVTVMETSAFTCENLPQVLDWMAKTKSDIEKRRKGKAVGGVV
eukprot:TRINITY_DN1472_c0_g1_i1.p2 TRINITY_DN1472_c0_g1~~TRINITY_DN1472_c0_g1_i1.p2  ORF type:complete len:63 (+),score=4.27 TRINITY_DN1472_c0_g1_i1:427-615(+)